MIGTHFSPVYTTRLSSSFSVHWVSGTVLALTHASFFGVVLPHLLLLEQEGLEGSMKKRPRQQLWTAELTA